MVPCHATPTALSQILLVWLASCSSVPTSAVDADARLTRGADFQLTLPTG